MILLKLFLYWRVSIQMVAEFDPLSLPREDFVVLNYSADEYAYVNVTLYELRNPGTESEERVLVENMQDSLLLVTPTRLVIEPDGNAQVRLVYLGDNPPEDSVYRVMFSPVSAPLSEEVTGVRIVVSYQALVIVPPSEPEAVLGFVRDGQSIKFNNTGNSQIRLEQGTVCDASTNTCEDLPARRLYAGNEWTLELPFDGQVQIQATNRDGVRTYQIN